MRNSYWQKTLQARRNRRWTLGTAGALGISAALFAACGGADEGKPGLKDTSGLLSAVVDDSKSLQRGGSLKLFHPFDQQTFDPMFLSLPNHELTNMAYSKLWFYPGGYLEPNRGVLEGDLAESWEFSPDKLQIILKLTDKAHFSPVAPTNGRAVDMQDVLYSWERFKAQGTRRFDLVNEVNPAAPIISISSTDARTLVIKLAEPNAGVPHMHLGGAGGLNIVPKEAENPNVLDLRRTQNGSGPWYLENYTPSASYKYRRNPGFKQDKRNIPYADEVEMPIVSEYAQQLAQFKAGAIQYTIQSDPIVRPDDLLATKREVPQLEMISTAIFPAITRTFWGWLPTSPFRDERVRQAWSMSIDRDLFIDVTYNVTKLRAEGLNIETAWDTALGCDWWAGWWLDPQGKEFGPNAIYYQHNVSEAKKLLAAAGYANGLDMTANYPSTGYASSYYKHIEVVLAMVQDAGFRPKQNLVNFNSEWRPQIHDTHGHFDGAAFVTDASPAEPAFYLGVRYGVNGSLFHGFDADGKGTFAGDPYLEGLLQKMRTEFDEKKRVQLAYDFQRYEAKKVYYPRVAGGANTFELGWPAVRGRKVWQGATNRTAATFWLDHTKAPLKST